MKHVKHGSVPASSAAALFAAALLLIAPRAAAAPAPSAREASVSAEEARGAWERAEAAWTAGRASKARRMTVKSEELDAKGKTTSWEETELALSYRDGVEEPDSTVLRAVKDGKDVTAERRAAADKAKASEKKDGRDDGGFPDPVPFGAEAADRLERGAAYPGTGGELVHEYTLKGKNAVRGKLSLGPDGLPLGIDYTISPLPPFVEDFRGSIGFEPDGSGGVRTEKLAFSGTGGLLFVKMRFRVEMRFNDFE